MIIDGLLQLFNIKDSIIQKVNCPWVMTYDNEISIAEIYQDFCIKKYDLMYSLANKGKASELIIFSQNELCPSNEELSENAIKIFEQKPKVRELKSLWN